ncbi:hypothetical protein BH10BDE1_BH10BDE1_17290 [soil metagenome]
MRQGPIQRFAIQILIAIFATIFNANWVSEAIAQEIPSVPVPPLAATPTPVPTPLPATGLSSPPTGNVVQAPPEPPAVTRKTTWIAHVLRRTPTNLRLKTLEFPETKLPVLLIARPGNLRPLVEVRGKYNRKGWTLFAQGSAVSQAAGQADFKFHAFLNGRINEVVLTTRGPNGEFEEERVYLFAPEAQEFSLISPWNAVVIAAGPSAVDYNQSGFGNYLAYTGSVSARYATFDGPKQLGMYASFDFTALTFASQPIDRGPQFIEAKLDATITVPFDPQQSYKSQILLGGSYTTMLSNGSPFGFSNLLSPEVGVRTRFILDPVDAIITDFRYVALGPSLDSLGSFNENGFLVKLTWSRTLMNSHRAELGLNYSAYSYHPETNATVRFNIISLLLGYSI